VNVPGFPAPMHSSRATVQSRRARARALREAQQPVGCPHRTSAGSNSLALLGAPGRFLLRSLAGRRRRLRALVLQDDPALGAFVGLRPLILQDDSALGTLVRGLVALILQNDPALGSFVGGLVALVLQN